MITRCATAFLAVLLAGCMSARPISFYTLSAEGEGRPLPRPAEGLRLGLGPVVLPPYLDRPDIVTRQGPNQVRLADAHRWAEPLEPMLSRTLAQDLHVLLGAEDVVPVPTRRDLPLDRVVEVAVSRLDAEPSGRVVLDARWWIFGGDGDTLLASGRSLIEEQGAPPPDYGAIVAAMSRAVAAAAKDIAIAIRGGAPVPERAPKRAAS